MFYNFTHRVHSFQSLVDVIGLTYEESLLSNALALFLASQDTTSLFLSYIFYEVAINPDVQEKLQVVNRFLTTLSGTSH